MTTRRTLRWLAGTALATMLLLAWGYRGATAEPVVRTATVHLPRWPVGAPAVRVALLSDVHAGNLAMGPRRLTRIVGQVNGLRPDLILIAGDFFPGHEPVDAASAMARLAPLKALRARLGVVAVPGNHDHWTGMAAVRAALGNAGIVLIANTAQVRGPLAIAAVDDMFSGHADVLRTTAAARRLPGARLVLTHSPDIAPQLPADFPLLLAGHTHCGQVVMPLAGSLADDRYYARRYRCGVIREPGRALIVTGGLGGSLPARFGAAPDVWLLTLGP